MSKPIACLVALACAGLLGAPSSAPPAHAQTTAGVPSAGEIAAALGGKIWAAPSGRQEGPFGPGEIEAMIAAGRIAADTLVFAAPLKTWTKASEIPALAGRIEARRQAEMPPAPPAPPAPDQIADVPPAPPNPAPPAPTPPVPVPMPAPDREETLSLPPGVDEARLRAVSANERADFGVAPIETLHLGAPHAPTPTSIPGGRLIDTLNLAALLGQQPPVPVLVLDALGGDQRLPNALTIPWAAGGRAFDDEVQQRLAQGMQQTVAGNLDVPVVAYCFDPHCWMSYNLALRLIRLGYRNVFWYRGGLEAWTKAGLPTQPQQWQ